MAEGDGGLESRKSEEAKKLEEYSLSDLILGLTRGFSAYEQHCASIEDPTNPYPVDNRSESRQDYWNAHILPIKEEINKREKEYRK